MMTRIILAFVAVFTSLALAEPASRPATAPAMPTLGATAVDFALQTLDGKSIRLSELMTKGPVVLVVLRGWPGYQCPICTRQVGELIAHEKELVGAGAQVLLVYPGPSDELKAHAAEFVEGKLLPASFHFVIDPDFTFTNAYGLRWDAPKETAYPSTFVIDARGVIRFAKISKTHGGRADVSDVLKALSEMKSATRGD